VRSHTIPRPAVQRISLYLRHLELLAERNVATVSSGELAEALMITAAQVRKDLAYLGQFGRPGVGYRVGPLGDALRHILGTDRTWSVIVVGAGDLGRALLRYKGFTRKGFMVVGAFDISAAKIGKQFGPARVQHLDEMPDVVARFNVRLAALAVPPEAAQEVTDRLCAAGIRGILNFAPTMLQVPPGVAVHPVDLAASMEQLAFRITARR